MVHFTPWITQATYKKNKTRKLHTTTAADQIISKFESYRNILTLKPFNIKAYLSPLDNTILIEINSIIFTTTMTTQNLFTDV